MLLLSDSPDAREIDPRSPLLTGYPLPSREFYVLALTWPAEEVRRPGCVWTHSLLLTEQVLELTELAGLLAALSRPEPPDWGPYSRSIEVPMGPARPQELPAVASTALWAVYEPPAPPVDIRVEALEGSDPHRFLLAIWQQQWPALRKSFTFAQSPRSARRLGEDLLDLQLTNSPQRGSWEQPPELAPLRTVTKPLETRPPAWCQALGADLASAGEMRDFLHGFGADVPASRESLWALAVVWLAIEPAYGSIGLDAAIDAITQTFPDREQASELKQAMFGIEPDTRLPHQIDPGEMLLAIARADLANDAHAIADLNLEQRTGRLLKTDEHAAWRIATELASPRPPKPARAVLAAIGDGLSVDQVREWVAHDPVMVALLAMQSSELAVRPALWTGGDHATLWHFLGRPTIARSKRAGMLRAILNAKANDLISAVLSEWPDGPELVLEAIHSGQVELANPGLLVEIPDERVLAWLKANGPSPTVTAALLEAWKPKQLVRVPVTEWNTLFRAGGKLSDFTLVLLFLAATDPGSQLGAKRAVAAYQELYRRAVSKALKKKALGLLARDADQSLQPAEQAAARLSNAFLSARWPINDLLEIDKSDAFRQVLRAEGSSTLVQKLIPTLDRAHASKAQGEAVWDALMDGDISTVRKGLAALRKYVPW